MSKSKPKSKSTSKAKPESRYHPLAEQLRGMIENCGLTTNGLAVACGVAQPILHRFVTGERDDIRISTADRLCEFFGVKLTAPKRGKGGKLE